MSAGPVELRLSPFVKCGREISNVGYLDVSTGRVVASLEVPLELIERAVLANLSLEIALVGDGRIASSVAGGAVCSSAVKTISIDHLIQRFLTSESLRLEETTQAELRTLLKRLQDSARAVQRAIALFEHSANEA
ncbi:hypothetical protein [Bradyrhizobium elkanii]|uniref:hypothetical protein n=1 Tax=Bradyrhizobium elkanii TaxID=29448 RepID=UPI003D1C8518